MQAQYKVRPHSQCYTHGTGVAPGESYPVVLGNLTGRRVVNTGVPGEVTAEGVARLPEVPGLAKLLEKNGAL